MPRRPDLDRVLRLRLAEEAARLITDEAVRDFQVAVRKAAGRLRVSDPREFPEREEIESALLERQRLFQSQSQPGALRRRLETALEAMRFLAPFEPRLVGPVLEGYADQFSAVCLHLFSDDADEVLRFLDEKGVRYEQEERRVRIDRERLAVVPALRFEAGGIPIDLTVFGADGLRQAPLERGGERPVRRAGLAAVRELLAAQARRSGAT
jgi:hypothetical protein